MNETDKHSKEIHIHLNNDYLVLNDSSFWDVTFDRFYGSNIKLISNNVFGKATFTNKYFQVFHVNHSSPKYDVWNVLSS